MLVIPSKKANEVKGNEMNSQNLVVCVDNSSKKSSAPYKMGGYKICIINYGDTQYNTSFITEVFWSILMRIYGFESKLYLEYHQNTEVSI